ncbi:ribosomal protein S18 acetylase RimI-like enzyme [Pullulanibacillus pueri]|uniref:N-acetyltransferase n=1 Tax=Pullulanibacillus pueri TaxID=1437324 RepID=A0A8J2ZVD4_9BACL|nr:GNAT family N-acetyltransferase [Pullulanibacillus pueri]MBM7680861.1 ribosomal protein S18 acetylase RimI-like enzyme [Pullulanibacillus pueri]GGH81123.1 N-acetyltransferase [Pullulanibacillus pueri]
MEELNSSKISPSVFKLLSFATSEKNINEEYRMYIKLPTRKLYGYFLDSEIVGCIGFELLGQKRCVIKHIAVSPSHRYRKIGSEMINFILEKYSLVYVLAETDNDAINFYRKYGFEIKSLGEKYPGVERFQCIFKNKSKLGS